MLFRTELDLKKSDFQISHSDKIVSIGSCFADCMGNRFQDAQFDILSNPYGVLYNPVAIFSNLESSLNNAPIDINQIIGSRETFFHYQFHSEINAKSKAELCGKLEIINKTVAGNLTKANYLFITLGTAFVYFLKEASISVANCHRQPTTVFDKRMLSIDGIVAAFTHFHDLLKVQNPDIRIVFSVSPVRHTKDTLELNTISKAILRLSCHEIVKRNPKNVSYFPAFEIMMDDLRDYRFYNQDMIHPTPQAETYIWEKFTESYFAEETIKLNKEIAEIQTSLSHRPFNEHGKEYETFLRKCQEKLTKLNDTVPVPSLLHKLAQKLNA